MHENNGKRALQRIFAGRLPVFGAMLLFILALFVIPFSSPLFQTLGFEYSALAALALSLVCGVIAASAPGTNVALRTNIAPVILTSVALALVPLALSVLSLIFIPNCSFWDGLLFYLEIALPSAVLGGLLGFGSRLLLPRKGWAIFGFLLFWATTLSLSLLPGYTNPQLYTYGWQYGFFPGFVWDAAITLKNAYWASRVEQIVWIAFIFSVSGLRSPQRKWLYPSLFLTCAIVLFILHDELGITASHSAVEHALSQIIEPASDCRVYFVPGSLSEDEQARISMNVRCYLHDIKQRFALPADQLPIRIYVYPSNQAMSDFVGTRDASIAKPWLSEVDISKGHLESLKHELTHVLLRRIGVFPFYASWATGVTEGAAMSVEPEYDGIYTLDEHAARILAMHYASGVKQVMSFSGFAASASEKSYVLAGSFSRFLLKTYGPARFDRVYASLDWKKEYGRSLDTLEAQWKRSLAPLMANMDTGDSAHFSFYYDRTAILFHPCLRRIGKLERNAAKAFNQGNFASAGQLYHDAIEDGDGIQSLAGLSDALLRENNLKAAIAVLDTTRSSLIRKQIIALDERRADLAAIANDTNTADSFYSRALSAKLSSDEFLHAYAHRVLLHSTVGSEWRKFLREEYLPNFRKGNTDSASIFEAFLRVWMRHRPQPEFDGTDLVLRYLYASLLEQKGEFAGAFHLDPCDLARGPLEHLALEHLALEHLDSLSQNDSLAVSLVALHFEKLVAGSVRSTLDGAIAMRYVPLKYRRAVSEMVAELREEAVFTSGE